MATQPLNAISDTQRALGGEDGLGRTHIYSLVNAGELVMVKIGRRSFITGASIDAYVERLAASADDVA